MPEKGNSAVKDSTAGKGSTVKRERRIPEVLVETAGLSREEWLEYRRQGIGGSDAAALMGISPFRTARDLYYDKLGIAAVEDSEDNWVALEMGTLLEDLVAKIFQKKTGFRIYQVKKMFRHPGYPFMIADVDYFVELPDGSTAILEIKTTNYNARDSWWKNGRETVPVYYESQGRHYMAVMDLDKVFFCCLYGNTEDEVIIRCLDRDPVYEEEMVFLEEYFWNSHVAVKVPPPYTEDGELIMESARRFIGPADTSAPGFVLEGEMADALVRYMELQKQREESEKHSKELEEESKRLKAILMAGMGKNCTAVCERDGFSYKVSYSPVRKPGISKDGLLRLKLLFPEIYEQFVTVTEFRRFQVKVSAEDAA